jgi:hypothetical protein
MGHAPAASRLQLVFVDTADDFLLHLYWFSVNWNSASQSLV